MGIIAGLERLGFLGKRSDGGIVGNLLGGSIGRGIFKLTLEGGNLRLTLGFTGFKRTDCILQCSNRGLSVGCGTLGVAAGRLKCAVEALHFFAGRGHIAFKRHNHVAGNLQLLGGGGEVLAQGGVLRLEALNTLVERVALRHQVFTQGLGKGEVFFELGNPSFALGGFTTSFTRALRWALSSALSPLRASAWPWLLASSSEAWWVSGNRGVACNLCGHGGHRGILKLSLKVKVDGLASVALCLLASASLRDAIWVFLRLGGITGLIVGSLKFGFQ